MLFCWLSLTVLFLLINTYARDRCLCKFWNITTSSTFISQARPRLESRLSESLGDVPWDSDGGIRFGWLTALGRWRSHHWELRISTVGVILADPVKLGCEIRRYLHRPSLYGMFSMWCARSEPQFSLHLDSCRTSISSSPVAAPFYRIRADIRNGWDTAALNRISPSVQRRQQPETDSLSSPPPGDVHLRLGLPGFKSISSSGLGSPRLLQILFLDIIGEFKFKV